MRSYLSIVWAIVAVVVLIGIVSAVQHKYAHPTETTIIEEKIVEVPVPVYSTLAYCEGWVDGFVFVVTDIEGPPPPGWVETQVTNCVRELGDDRMEST